MSENGETRDELLTTEAVAEWLGVKPRTVLEWARTNRIPSLLAGRLRRYRRSEIAAWLERDRQSGGDLSRPLDKEGAEVHRFERERSKEG